MKEQVPDKVLIPLLVEVFGKQAEILGMKAGINAQKLKQMKSSWKKAKVEQILEDAGELAPIIESIYDSLYIEGKPSCVNHGYKQVKKQVKCHMCSKKQKKLK